MLSAVVWGFVTPMSRLAYDGGATPDTVVEFRSIAFVVLVAPLLACLGRPLRLDRGGLVASIWIGLAVFGMSFGYLSSVAYIPVSLAAIVFYSFPLIVGLLASAAGREPMTWLKAATLTAAFASLALALGPDVAGLDWRGLAFALLAAVSVASLTAFSGSALRRADPMLVNVFVNLWVGLAFGAYAFGAGRVTLPGTLLGFIGLGSAVLCYVGAALALFAALSMISPMRVGLLSNAEPLVTIVIATTLLGESLTGVQAGGMALVLGAIVALTLLGRREPG